MNQFIPDQKVLNFQRSRQLRLINADLKARGVHKSARELFVFLWRCAHTYKPNGKPLCPKGLIFKVETLAEHIEVSERTIQRNIRLLAEFGLLQVGRNTPPRRGGSPTNKLWPIWNPLTPEVPAPEKVTAPPKPVEQNPEHSISFTMEREAVFVWPAVSPSTPTTCHPEVDATTRTAPSFARTFADAREKDPTYSMSEQPIPGAPVYVFDSASALRLFLIFHLEVPPRTLDEWILRYGLPRVAQVAHWVLSDTTGTIQQVGGWMRRALDQHWSAPKAVEDARNKALAAAKYAQRKQEEANATREAMVQSAAIDEQREQIWQAIAPYIEDLPELYAIAEQNAQQNFGSMLYVMFRRGSFAWKELLINAALEHPDLWQSKVGAEYTA